MLTRQLTRLLLLRILVLLGLLLFVWRTFSVSMNGDSSSSSDGSGGGILDMSFSLPIFVASLFVLTLMHLWWLRSGQYLELLTRIQCALDPLLVVILVILTGNFHSPFLFLNGLVTLNAALLLGRREALLTAGMILIFSAGGLSLAALLLHIPVEPAPVLLRGFLLHGVAYFLTALLGGALAQRAANLQHAYDRQKDSLADWVTLHEQIVAAVSYGLISVNNQGIIRAVNPAACELITSNLTPLLDRSLPTEFPEFYWAIENANGEDVYVEINWSERIWGVNVSFLYNHRQEQIGTLLVIRDLSPMKQLEHDLAEKERLALIGRMSAGMAHEIRNPLASILSAAQMLTAKDNRETRLLNIIREEVIRLKQLTGDFLLFSKPVKPTRQKILLAEFLTEMNEQIKKDPRWGTRELLISIHDPKITIWFDTNHLRQIFLNLFINAMQAAPEGQCVTVNLIPINHQIRLLVCDDGPGVDTLLLPKLIEPFFTTQSSGSGLGLSVVHHLTVLNGGSLHLNNGPQGGLQVELRCEAAHG